MEKLMKFIKTDNGKLVAVVAGVVLLLIIIKVATPSSLNFIINNGSDCVLGFKSAKKSAKRKKSRKKDK